MEGPRWERTKSLFVEAAGLPPEIRREFLTLECGLDDELRLEVESLLEEAAADGGFLEKPALAYAVEWLGEAELPDPVEFGNYRAIREIARGGMSTVYLGERADGQYQKQVAIKLLRSGVYGADVHRWFLRERQLLADFDHPNIVRLLDGGVTMEGLPYLVEEYVDGPSITEYAAAHDLTPRQRLRLMMTVAGAVEYLHQRGVVHGDLKPANILVTNQGEPRIVDFGVARLLPLESRTVESTIAGNRPLTPAYASPEQTLGQSAVPVSDIYSLGLVLFELLQGRPAVPVDGAPAHEVARRICEVEPDMEGLSEAAAGVVQRAIDKSPGRRWQSAGELAGELERLCGLGDGALNRPAGRVLRARRWAGRGLRFSRLAFGAVGILCAAAILLVSLRQPPAERWDTLRTVGLAVTPWWEAEPRLSPDGSMVAYSISSSPTSGIYVRSIAGGEARRITSPSEGADRYPDWSSDGARILFSRHVDTRVEIWVMRSDGSAAVKVREWGNPGLRAQRSVRWASFAPGNSIAVAEKTGSGEGPFAIFLYSFDGRKQRQLTFPIESTATGDTEWAFSPDGGNLAFIRYSTGSEADIYVTKTSGGEAIRLTHDAAHLYGLTYSADGKHVFYGGRRTGPNMTLWRLPVSDSKTAEPEPVPLVTGDATWPSAAVDSTSNHMRVAYQVTFEPVNILRWDEPWEVGEVRNTYPSLHHDGRAHYTADGGRMTFTTFRSGRSEVWVANTDGSDIRPLTSLGDGLRDAPRWSPDGSEIVFSSTDGKDTRNLFVANAATGKIRRLTTSRFEHGRPSWSQDGEWVYFRSVESGRDEIWRIPSRGGKPVQITRSGAFESFESVDGTRLFFTRPRPVLGVWSVPTGGGPETLVVDGVREGVWSVAADGIYWITTRPAGHVMKYSFRKRNVERIATIPDAESGIWSGFSVRRDGKSILWSQTTAKHSDIMLLEWQR